MDNNTLYGIFKMAIENEYDASEFYRKAAEKTTNIEAKRLFEKFAVIELKHKNELEGLYVTLKK